MNFVASGYFCFLSEWLSCRTVDVFALNENPKNEVLGSSIQFLNISLFIEPLYLMNTQK